jgi:hypothetical protein
VLAFAKVGNHTSIIELLEDNLDSSHNDLGAPPAAEAALSSIHSALYDDDPLSSDGGDDDDHGRNALPTTTRQPDLQPWQATSAKQPVAEPSATALSRAILVNVFCFFLLSCMQLSEGLSAVYN